MLKMSVTGRSLELYQFVNDLKPQLRYGVEIESQAYISPDLKEKEIVANIDFVPNVRKPLIVRLETAGGNEVQIHLFDSVIAELERGVTFISGKVFDAFA